MLQRDFRSAKSTSPHTEASAGERLLSLRPLQGLQNQTEDETQPEEVLSFLSILFCLVIELAQTLHSG